MSRRGRNGGGRFVQLPELGSKRANGDACEGGVAEEGVVGEHRRAAHERGVSCSCGLNLVVCGRCGGGGVGVGPP